METVGTAANVIIGIVALLHTWFLTLEMFLWDKPAGLKAFKLSPEDAARTKSLAANQGLYNGFLVAGLLWGLLQGTAGNDVKIFFVGCVIVAGVFGAATVSSRILFIQALPAVIALALWLMSTST